MLVSSQMDGLCRVADLHGECARLRGDAEVLVAQPADQVEGLARRLRARQPECVRCDGGLDRRAYLRRGTKEAVGRHQPGQRLVWPLEVVVLDVEAEPAVAVSEVGEDGPRQELLPERLPEALDLAERLRVLRPALDVPDAVLTQRLLEGRLPAPGGVLPTLVGQDLLRRPVRGDPALEGLEDQARLLVVRQRVGDQVARVVVHERCHVQALVLAQEEGEDVRLPELVRCRPLEAARRMRARRRRRPLVDETLLVKDAPDDRLRHPQSLEARQHVPDATGPPLRVLRPGIHHRLAARTLALRRPSLTLGLPPRLEGVHPAPPVQPEVLLHRRVRHTERHRDVDLRASAKHLPDDPDPHVVRNRPPRPASTGGLPCRLLLRHPVSSFRPIGAKAGAGVLCAHPILNCSRSWRAGHASKAIAPG